MNNNDTHSFGTKSTYEIKAYSMQTETDLVYVKEAILSEQLNNLGGKVRFLYIIVKQTPDELSS